MRSSIEFARDSMPAMRINRLLVIGTANTVGPGRREMQVVRTTPENARVYLKYYPPVSAPMQLNPKPINEVSNSVETRAASAYRSSDGELEER